MRSAGATRFSPMESLQPVIRRAKSAIKQTPLWPLLRPRRMLVYGVGAPKTGTKSIARIFSASYRSFHEPHVDTTIDIIEDKLNNRRSPTALRQELRDRDRRWRLEVESQDLLTYLAGELAEVFPHAQFICTVRAPYPWMKSMINQRLNVTHDDLPAYHQRSRAWRRAMYNALPPSEYPSEEHPLVPYEKKYGVRNIDSYVVGWRDQYERILDELPNERVLFIRTSDISESIQHMAAFLNIPEDTLSRERSHANQAPARHEVLAQIDTSYIQDKIETHCGPIIARIEDRLGKPLRAKDR